MTDDAGGAGARSARVGTAAGVASQLANVGTNFAALFIASAVLDPAEFGRFAVAFAVVTILNAGSRGLLGTPLVAHLPRVGAEDGRSTGSSALGLAGLWGLGAIAICLGVSVVVPAAIWFVPWVIPSLVHDVCRNIEMGSGRNTGALRLDVTWAVASGVALLVWIAVPGDLTIAAISSSWGVGALVAVARYAVTMRQGVASPRRYLEHTRRFVGWFAASSVVGQIETYALLFVTSALLAPEEAGGLRAVQLLMFQPAVALLGAVAVVAVPATVRAGMAHPDQPVLRSLAVPARWSLTVAAGVGVAVVLHRPLMSVFFPKYADRFSDLAIPVAIQSLVLAGAVPAVVLLTSVLAARAATGLILARGVLTVAVATPLLDADRLAAATWATSGIHLVVVAATYALLVARFRHVTWSRLSHAYGADR